MAGTQREDPPALSEAWSSASREDRLLRGASLAGLRRLAGKRATPASASTDDVCPPETLPEAPAAAAVRLADQ